jgi:hypothetical protein
MGRKEVSWYFDRLIIYIILFAVAVLVLNSKGTILPILDVNLKGAYDTFINSVSAIIILSSILGAASVILKPYEEETNSQSPPTENKEPLEEYKEGNKYSQSIIKASWTATSIFLPVCFGLVAVSYSEPLLKLSSISLTPLAMASVSIFLVWWLYTNRYAGYNRSIWKRLREIEGQLGMKLHTAIDKDDKSRRVRWRIRHVNGIMFFLLIVAWLFRLVLFRA